METTTQPITDNAVLLNVSLHSLSNRKQIGSEIVETQADKRYIHASKTLMVADELTQLTSIDQSTGKHLRSIGLKSYFKPGMYLIPLPMVSQANEFLMGQKAKRNAMIFLLEEQWDSYMEKMRESLAEQFNPNDYADAESLKSYFRMNWHFIEIGVPQSVSRISVALFKQEQEKAAELWKEIMEEARNCLRRELGKFVKDWQGRLSGELDGKPKRIQNRSLNTLNEWLDRFLYGGRDLTDDDQIRSYVEDLRSSFIGMNAKMLNKEPVLQKHLKDQLDKISNELTPLVENIPKRFMGASNEI